MNAGDLVEVIGAGWTDHGIGYAYLNGDKIGEGLEIPVGTVGLVIERNDGLKFGRWFRITFPIGIYWMYDEFVRVIG